MGKRHVDWNVQRKKYALRVLAEQAVWKVLAEECEQAADRVRTVIADHFPGDNPSDEQFAEIKEVFLDVAEHFKKGRGLK